MRANLNFIGILTGDLAGSLRFYRALGVPVPDGLDDAPHVEVAFDSGLRLAWDPIETVRSFNPDAELPVGPGRVSLAFEQATPADVDRTYASLVTAGATGEVEPFDAPWGQRYATVLDPDGNSVDLYAGLP